MPNHVLQIDCSGGITGLEAEFDIAPYAGPYSTIWVEADFAFNSTYLTALLGGVNSDEPIILSADGTHLEEILVDPTGSGGWTTLGRNGGTFGGAPAGGVLAQALAPLQFYHLKLRVTSGSPASADAWIDSVSLGPITMTGIDIVGGLVFLDIVAGIVATPGALAWFDNVIAGTTEGASDILSDDFEGVGAPSASIWNSLVDATVIVDPGIAPADVGTLTVGRVLIAFDDGPLVAAPTWTAIDQGGAFPDGFVSGYDLSVGRQTLLAQTDTGTATVYINDHELALFDPRNVSSPYFGKLDGRQIKLQLYDPVRAVWESQFQGHIDEVTYDIDGSAADANGDPINASLQINCVDIFDYLAGYGLTPGLNGVMPTPAGGEDGVWYAETVSFVDDRIIEILTDVGIDTTRYVVFSGNVKAREVKYDPDESAMVALRDASDAEFPFIANMYVDRFGRYCWHGRYGRFDPAGVSSDAGTARWDWHDWQLGDGKAIVADSTRTQIRVLNYTQARNQVVNVAVCYPQGMEPAQMPSQVFADTTSITAYGKFSAPPMSDLLVKEYIGPGAPQDANAECLLYAKLLVKNQKDPRVSISAIQLKSIQPSDPKAANVWACLSQCDISDLVNVEVGYPAGTGLAGDSPEDDYFVEGRQMRVRPAQPGYDYVELDLNVSPFVWSADTHSVFPARGDSSDAPGLVADFSAA